MSCLMSSGARRVDRLEWIMVAIYMIVTVYISILQPRSTIGIAVRQAASPFQLKARARNAGAARNALAWRLYRVQARARELTAG